MLNGVFNKPHTLAILTVLCWSFSSLLAKLISIQSPYLLFSFSFSFALIVYLIIAYKIYRNHLFQTIKKVPIKYFLIGLCGYYAVWIGNTESFRAFNSASETTVLNYTWLIFTVFFSETIYKKQDSISLKNFIEFLGILFGFISVFILAVHGNILSFKINNINGILWGLFGGMSYGFFSAYSSTLNKERQIIFLISAISASLLAMLITSYFKSGNIILQAQKLSWQKIGLTALLGLLVDALGYIMWTRSLSISRTKNINVSKTVSIIFILPLTSLLIVSFYLKEYTITKPYFIVCILFLLGGLALTQKSGKVVKLIKSRQSRVDSFLLVIFLLYFFNTTIHGIT
jgi:drug/metabolite transporter (DMT)-like permease